MVETMCQNRVKDLKEFPPAMQMADEEVKQLQAGAHSMKIGAGHPRNSLLLCTPILSHYPKWFHP